MTSESQFGGEFTIDGCSDAGGRERPFGIDELFFSRTDARGVIRSYNDVFLRVCGYRSEELRGRPHNVIRHPDMPRAVFRLLWCSLEAGAPIMAYVKNRANDGAHYWVAAAARPISDGYLSVRLKPTTALFRSVAGVYDEMSEIERCAEREGVGRQAAMDRSTAHLLDRLREFGFDGYEAFMQEALIDEVRARHAALHGGDRRSADDATGRLTEALEDVGRYVSLSGRLAGASSVLVDIADEGKLLALNAVLASRRLGGGGETLVAVTKALQEAFPTMSHHARDVVDHIGHATSSLQHAGFATALAVLQNDMLTTFRDETASGRAEADEDLLELLACSRHDVEVMGSAVGMMVRSMRETTTAAARLEGDLTLLGSIERNGRIEAARTGHLAGFSGLLDTVRGRVAEALAHTREVMSLVHQLDALDRLTRHALEEGQHV